MACTVRVGSPCNARGYGDIQRSPKTWATGANSTWRVLYSLCLGMSCFLLRDDNVLREKELHRSLQV